jgi:predicted PurR-regulated permease PerM
MVIVYGQQIIMPLMMAFFTSIVLLPFFRLQIRKKIPRTLAISLSILLMMIVSGLIIYFVTIQIKPVIDDMPTVKHNLSKHINDLSEWFRKKTNISSKQQSEFISGQSQQLLDTAGGLISGAAGSIGSALVFFVLIPIYTFLILFYKDLLVKFAFMWFPQNTHPRVREVLIETESIIQSYIGGLLIQITYITILLGGTLLIFGIPHALLIGITFAILNLIPYIGALFGNIIGVLLTLSSSPELSDVITVLLVIAAVQFLDNNILMPRIVGGKVSINALSSIVAVFVGGALAGVPGMFLSLPMLAVMKVIFDHTEQFRQWGVLFGDESPRKIIKAKRIKK